MAIRSIIITIFLICYTNCEIGGSKKYSTFFYSKHEPQDMTIHKVTLTQKGYIQFLKYMTKVPDITEFTFCIWMRSSNLTHSHPILSYSIHEERRLIRTWISDHGRTINMAILEQDVFKVTANLQENHWNHVCPSWNSKKGAWSLYVNGKQKDAGVISTLKDAVIPGGGDIVVGQEYTDFDKGLDDGIEGDIYGFNLILSSTQAPQPIPPPIDYTRRRQLYIPTTMRSSQTYYTPPQPYHSSPQPYHPSPQPYHQSSHSYHPSPQPYHQSPQPYQSSPQPYQSSQQPPFTFGATIPIYGYQVQEEDLFNADHLNNNHISNNQITPKVEPVEVPQVLGYFKTATNRQPKGIMDFGRDMLQNFYKYLEPTPRIRVTANEYQHISQNMKQAPFYVYKNTQRLPFRGHLPTKRISNELEGGHGVKSLGLLMVELSYNDCALGKGSPINDEKVLISWTKTPVRVFGGAMLKTVPPFCRKF